MSIKNAIYTHLQTVGAVTSLIGTSLYPLQAPQQKATPYVVYTLMDADRQHHMRGTTLSVFKTLQMDIYANTDTKADSISTALLNALDSLQGLIQTVQIEFCLNNDEDDALLEPIHGEGLGIPARILAFRLAYQEPRRDIHT